MPSGGVDEHRVAEAERELQVRALGLDAVTDADDLQGLGVALGHADDHVGDQRAGQAVQRADLVLVVGPGDGERAVVVRATVIGSATVCESVPLGPLTVTSWPSIVTSTPLGTGMRQPSDSRHAVIPSLYQT